MRFAILCLLTLAGAAHGEPLTLAPVSVTEWKAVYGRIEARDRIPARARLGGTLTALDVAEGDLVTAGQVLGQIVDEKLAFQLSALEAQVASVQAQLVNATAELKRGEDLLKQGVTTVQRLDALRTQVDVLTGQIAAVEAQRKVVVQQAAEGAVLAPVAGRVLDVPVSKGAVVMPGEALATLGGGGIFLRLAVPERHAAQLHAGDAIQIEGPDGIRAGRLARIYPLIENGRVVADVEVDGLSDTFVDARVLVRLPVGARTALMVPVTALVQHSGLDFVAVTSGEGIELRAVVPGQVAKGADMVEILSGLQSGDVIETVASAPGVAHAE
jgi:RND family efflux transporter MFP subunit